MSVEKVESDRDSAEGGIRYLTPTNQSHLLHLPSHEKVGKSLDRSETQEGKQLLFCYCYDTAILAFSQILVIPKLFHC